MQSTRVRGRDLRLVIGVTFVGALVAAAGIAVNAVSHRQTELPIQAVDVSWAYGFASAAEMGKQADLVVVGTVTNVASEGADVSSPHLAATRFAVEVGRTVKGEGHKAVIVKQTGGVLGAVRQVVDGDPLMAVGNRYLLYPSLVREGPYTGDYWILGGAQGRFGVDTQGNLTPFGSVTAPAGVTADTVTAQQ